METEPFVCVCVCLCQLVSTLMAERIDVRTQNLVQGSTLIKSWTSLMVKVTRSKNVMSDFLASVPVYKMLACSVTLWCNVTSWYDIKLRRHDVTAWHYLSFCCEIGSARGRYCNNLVFFHCNVIRDLKLWFLEPICAYARLAHMLRFLSACLYVT